MRIQNVYKTYTFEYKIYMKYRHLNMKYIPHRRILFYSAILQPAHTSYLEGNLHYCLTCVNKLSGNSRHGIGSAQATHLESTGKRG